MQITELKPKQALNKAFLKVKPIRIDIDRLKVNLVRLFDGMNDTESEEFHKNLLADFFKNTYYNIAESQTYFINTKGRNDLVVHNGPLASSSVGVIIEAKKPTNKTEMMGRDSLNVKAFQELVLYYLRERITYNNLEIRHLIVTNVNEWFIFDAVVFDRLFAQNKNLVAQFEDFEAGRLADTKTDFFYKQIAQPFIAGITTEVEFTYLNLQDYQPLIRSANGDNDKSLIALFKLLSPVHLLKEAFANDSNSLDSGFYNELLHIIGLTEVKESGKKLIGRNKESQRNLGTILEDAIVQLDSLEKIDRLEKPSLYGNTHQERLFSVALELSITWINRILFLKLLEAQLLKYHNNDKTYSFLNINTLKKYDDLNGLFFQVLARQHHDRNDDVRGVFEHIPYLNSSLFEPTETEQVTIFVSGLKDDRTIPISTATVLKDQHGKKRTGSMTTLAYLFAFLNAYDFAGEGSEEIQEDNKTLINASVLGLIFEKINGYKDGSFFTPGFITMYMCRETIRKAVIEKFRLLPLTPKGEIINNIEDIYGLIPSKISRKTANEIINSIKICDPAVGSGHFLVSALNEVIAIKNDLKILEDKNGKPLHRYEITVVNDELTVMDEDGELFEYKPKSKESQRVQETLFHEKQTIIENCLFGVDINPNSVKICRLRLWIELLKNAYYKMSDVGNMMYDIKKQPPKIHHTSNTIHQLQTLPNIDINIKCGNSLVSRFAIDADLSQALRKSKFSIDSYKTAVDTYRNTTNRGQKREMERLILEIKQSFATEIRLSNPLKKRLDKLAAELYHRFTGAFLFESKVEYKTLDPDQSIKEQTERQKLETEINELSDKVADIKADRVYENAFEWRFEFPEVLNDNGDFMGFDVVIGNPPYGVKFNDAEKDLFKTIFQDVHARTPESYNYFIRQFIVLSSPTALCCLIVPSSFLNQAEFKKTRKIILDSYSPYVILNLGDNVFPEVATPTCLIGFDKQNKHQTTKYDDITALDRKILSKGIKPTTNTVSVQRLIENASSSFIYRPHPSITKKCYADTPTLKDIAEEVATGVSPGLGDAFIINIDEAKNNNLETKIIKKLIIGGEITRFQLRPKSNKGLIYLTNKIVIEKYPQIQLHLSKYKDELENRSETKSGLIPWYVMLRPRREKLFENPKILIRQTANRIMAAYDEDKWYCLKSGIIVQLPAKSEISYKYLLALLNSSLMDFLYNDLVNEDNRIFPEVKPVQLFKLPIKVVSKERQKIISVIVDKTIRAKQKAKDTTALEAEIDRLVYELYELTTDEIAIVEGTVN